jgi:hypothetical protein
MSFFPILLKFLDREIVLGTLGNAILLMTEGKKPYIKFSLQILIPGALEGGFYFLCYPAV